MSDAFIVTCARSPIGKFLGGLTDVSATKLGALAIAEVLKRGKVDPTLVDEVIMGCVIQAGLGQNPARQSAIHGGLPDTISAVTVNKVCGSGLQAVMQAAQSIRAGDNDVVIAGGFENMSRAPYLLQNARTGGFKYGDQTATDAMINDGLWCAFESCHMGNSAEHIARKHSVSREDQDRFSAKSQQRAAAAWSAGNFAEEVFPVTVGSGAKAKVVDKDEGIRAETTAEGLSKLRTAFPGGTSVTAGNASTINDGSAAILVASSRGLEKLGSKPIARVVAYATSGVAPKDIFIAPVSAVNMVLQKAKLTLADIDYFELNEAFAAQMLACNYDLKIDEAKLNVNGGAIALGHPIGASGARCLVTLLSVLKQRNAKRGLVSLCLGGGNAVAMVVERV
ncbi:MAG: acetyl-CoA C-acetyltransferase [Planctomycetia bacterium]|nr:acetyl-CoA C-acetyltransferase [Planctomycetia bacterium]